MACFSTCGIKILIVQNIFVFGAANTDQVTLAIHTDKLSYSVIHGNVTTDFLRIIKKIQKIKIIKAIQISNKNSIKKISNFKKVSDYILLDTKIVKKNLNLKKSKELNWNLIKKIKNKASLILSGALNINNLKNATKETNFGFVDVSSGLETISGKKSIKKIDKFLQLATKL